MPSEKSNVGGLIEIPQALIWGDTFSESCLINRLIHRLGGEVTFSREELAAMDTVGFFKSETDATISVPPVDEERVIDLPPLPDPTEPEDEAVWALGGSLAMSARVLAACVVRLGGKLAVVPSDEEQRGQVRSESNRLDDGGYWIKVDVTYPKHEDE